MEGEELLEESAKAARAADKEDEKEEAVREGGEGIDHSIE